MMLDLPGKRSSGKPTRKFMVVVKKDWWMTGEKDAEKRVFLGGRGLWQPL